MLVERDSELAELDKALGSIAAAGGKVVLIRGDAGIGKSALVSAFLEEHEGEIHAHAGYCDDLLTPQPLGPIWDLADQVPDLAENLEKNDRRAVMASLRDLMSTRLRPAVVVIEDTQWIDEASLDVVRYLGRRITDTHGLLILTYRDSEVDYEHPLRSVIASIAPSSIVRVGIGPLSPAAVREFVGDPGVDVDRLVDLTGGNALLVNELSMSGLDQIPASVQESVLGRAASLQTAARDLFDTVAVVPGGLEFELIPTVGDFGESELEDVSRTGLLTHSEDRVAFRHEILRRAAEAALSPARMKSLNATVMRALIDNDADIARIVHHARGAGDVEAIVEYAPRAGSLAMQMGSHREAVDHFRSLEPHLDRVQDSQRGAIVEDWARSEFFHDSPEAVDLINRAIAIHRDHHDHTALGRSLTFAVRLFEANGRPDDADRAAREALKVTAADPQSAANALAQSAWLALMRGENYEADELADRALAMADSHEIAFARLHALNTKGFAEYAKGVPGGLKRLEEAHRMAAEGGHLFEEARALINLAGATLDNLDLDEAAEYSRAAIETSAQYEIEPLEAYGQTLLAMVLLYEGKWDEAEDLAYASLDSHPHVEVQAVRILGVIHARTGRGDPEELLQRAWQLAQRSREIQNIAPSAAAWAEYCWIRGRSEDPRLAECREAMVRAAERRHWRNAGEIALWLHQLDILESVPRELAAPYSNMISGDHLGAADRWEELRCPYEQAIALMGGSRDEKLQALELLESLGARAVASKYRQAMRAVGISVPRGRSQRTRSHPAGLTPRQSEVLGLLAIGLTNSEIADRLFVSLKTVENHVSAVLAKLGAASRDEAAKMARDQELIEA